MLANYSKFFHLKSKYRIDEQEFKQRTKQLVLRVIELVSLLQKNTVSEVIGNQLIRSGTSVGANYRAACRARSTADLIAKLRIVEEEADESLYWMELIVEAELVDATKLKSIMSETNDILAMTVASIKTLVSKNQTANRR
ncbi:MAG TPA: four helix bundle protein [Microcoleus sp.]|nr:four helix bundle protein [Microcoleus sp.]